MLSGTAGHTYGAAGVWHMGVEGDPGITPIYDWTTWKEGMNFPGSTQLGLGKELLEQYPWAYFQPHPEWVEAGSFAAGIPGEVRFIYLPRRRGVYNWSGPLVKHMERDVPYSAFYFNPTNAKRYKLGTFVNDGPPTNPFDDHQQPILFEDRFESADSSAWRDYGTPSQRKNGRLVGGKGIVTVLEKVTDADLMTSAPTPGATPKPASSSAFTTPTTIWWRLYSPSLHAIFLHDRKDGQWGDQLGSHSCARDRAESPSHGGGLRRLRSYDPDGWKKELLHAHRQSRQHQAGQGRSLVLPDRRAPGIRRLRVVAGALRIARAQA